MIPFIYDQIYSPWGEDLIPVENGIIPDEIYRFVRPRPNSYSTEFFVKKLRYFLKNLLYICEINESRDKSHDKSPWQKYLK